MKCVDIRKGVIKLSDDLVFYPGYSFDTFKNSKYYSGQGEIEEIYLDDIFIIENRQFKVQLCFYDRKICDFSLVCIDEEYTWETEHLRMYLHNRVLTEWGLSQYNEFDWGKVYSDFDEKGCTSSILFIYNK